MIDVFVSYASEERDRVRPLVAALEDVGWTVWWDRQIGAGTAFDREIEKAIDEAKCIVVVWSKHSVESEWVRTEANEGLEKNNLVPVNVDGVRPPLAFRRIQTISIDPLSAGLDDVKAAIERLAPIPKSTTSEETPYVGRAAELARMRALVERVRGGAGAAVLIAGEAGVGKSRLAREIGNEVQQLGFGVLRGHCLDMDGAPPYQPLIEQIDQAARNVPAADLRETLGENAPELAKLMPELRQLFPDIAEPIALPPEQERRYLLHGVGEFIDRASRPNPLMLTFEDLHWADESTCVLLRHLAGRLEETPVFIVGTYRDSELDPSRPFARALHDLVRERLVDDLVLKRLDRHAVTELLAAQAGQQPPAELVELVYSETEGNPFFVEEVYRHLNDSGKLFDEGGAFRSAIEIADTEVPRGVRLVLGQRVERVSDDCRRVLTTAAVLGRIFQFDLLASAGGVDEDTLLDAMEEAEAASLVRDLSREREARYGFVHEQIRQTLLSALSFPRRQRLHLRVANALEEFYGNEAEKHAGEISHHLYQAGAAADAERTAHYLELAARRALDSLAFEDALRELDMALAVMEDDGGAARASVQAKRAMALRGAARIEESLEALADAMSHSKDTPFYDELLMQRARLFVDAYRGREAVPDIEELLERARAANDSAKELEAQLVLATAHYILSLDQPEGAEQARASCERAIELARDVGDRRALGQALMGSAHFVDYWRDYYPQARANVAQALEIAKEIGDEDLEIEATINGMRMQVVSPDDRSEEAERLRERLVARRDPLRLKEYLFWMMWQTYGAGRLERCVEVCDEGIGLADRLGAEPVQYPTIKALALMDLGRFGEAKASLGQEVADAEHRFGAAFQKLGEFIYQTRLKARDKACESARAVAPELHALNRTQMVSTVIDSLAEVAGEEQPEADVVSLMEEISKTTGVEVGRLARLRLMLGEGRAQEALDALQGTRERYAERGQSRAYVQALELSLMALKRLERWGELREQAEELIEVAKDAGYRNFEWRAHAFAADAHDGLGDADKAAAAREQAGSVLRSILASVPQEDAEVRQCLERDQMAAEVL
jgi:hypothetical protein